MTLYQHIGMVPVALEGEKSENDEDMACRCGLMLTLYTISMVLAIKSA
jgi:hypothetical protein